MGLVVQIALGVFLGFLLIEHRHRLGHWALFAIKGALILVTLGLLAYGASELIDAAGDRYGQPADWLAKFVDGIAFYIPAMLAGIAAFLGLAYVGYSLSAVLNWVTNGFFKVATSLESAGLYVWLPVVGLGVLLIQGVSGSSPLDQPYRSFAGWLMERGFSVDAASEISSSVVLLAPLISPVLIHVALRLSGARVAALWPEGDRIFAPTESNTSNVQD